MKQASIYFLIALLVILIDQASKIAVFNYMTFGPMGEIPIIGDIFKLHYTLNPGMAFGMEFGSAYGKLGLTFFRMIAMIGISWYLLKMVKEKAHKGFLICLGLILGGAIGNLVDSTFYGVFLEYNAIVFSGEQPPFYPWFHGQVIDMLYVDIWEGPLPEYLPIVGGKYYSLWPIFNIADASIFTGVTAIFVFQGKFFPQIEDERNVKNTQHEDMNTSAEKI